MDDFQVLVKIAGGACNLRCRYCYYLPQARPGEAGMPDDLVELYVRQHIEASRDPVVAFAWHGGEPTLYGLGRFRKIAALQESLCPPGRRVVNGIQTNGLLLDEEWCRFLAHGNDGRGAVQFVVGLSLDGPEEMHDRHRVTAGGEPTFRRVMESFARLRRHGVPTECLCVVHSDNAVRPLDVYGFFRSLGAPHLTFLPLVERMPDGRVGGRSVSSADWGAFLCATFDEWQTGDIGRIQVQLFEETARTAFGQEHSLCILRHACGGVPALDCNGDLYCCDHFMTPGHLLGNIREATLKDMLASPKLRDFGEAKWRLLPARCRRCPVLGMCGGGCPKDRILAGGGAGASADSGEADGGTADGGGDPAREPRLNFLCEGYKRFFLHAQPFVRMLAALRQQ
ncbi:MAG: SPASM domain-containing protein [Acidobacteriota bacterium]|jgi:uncharacterized protein|nr:SPASM domain-containing protein [Acidobacteriota bacterium]